MKVLAGNAWARLDGATREEREWLDEQTSVPVTRYRPGQWGPVAVDDRERTFDWRTGRFPAGLVPLVRRAGRAAGRDVQLVDTRGPAPCAPDPAADLGWLRDYQRAAVDAFLRRGRGIIKAPTASGKTEVGIGIVRSLPCRWLFVVHRADLMHQTAKRYTLRTGDADVGIIGDGEHSVGSRFTVATFQTLNARLKDRGIGALALLDQFEGLMVDETHAQSAKTFYGVSMEASRAYFRCGLSATPLDRGEFDALRVQGALGPIVHEIPTEVLVERGLLSKPAIYMVPCAQSWPKAEHAEWGPVYQRLVVRSAARNALLAEMARRAAKPALCFVEQLDQARALEALMRAKGLAVATVDGRAWTAARQREVKRLVQGKTDVLICTVIFQDGIDIPELGAVIVGTGKASVVATLQRIGRGMRTAAGKSTFEVWDVLDRGQRWLERHAEERRAAYEREGHAVRLDWPAEGTGAG